jgi:outer membrane lipoprotein LolB
MCRLLGLLGSGFLALSMLGCTSLPSREPATWAGGSISGRLSIQASASTTDADKTSIRPFNAQFELRGQAHAGELDVLSPLGTVLARAHWSPESVWLQKAGEEAVSYASLSDLSEQALGQKLPVAAFFDWFNARVWPAVSHTALTPSRFEQLGWEVDTSRCANGWIVLQRRTPAPAMTVRVRRDDPACAGPIAPL